jgi:hypothetical protein
MEAICSSETSVDFQRAAWHYIPEDKALYNHRSENLILRSSHQPRANSTEGSCVLLTLKSFDNWVSIYFIGLLSLIAGSRLILGTFPIYNTMQLNLTSIQPINTFQQNPSWEPTRLSESAYASLVHLWTISWRNKIQSTALHPISLTFMYAQTRQVVSYFESLHIIIFYVFLTSAICTTCHDKIICRLKSL